MDCIICLENETKKKFVLSPSFEALEKLLNISRKRASYKDNIVTSFVERITDKTAKELSEFKVCYHESCYSNLANVGKLERAIMLIRLIQENHLLSKGRQVDRL